jgi:hypothetical protein
MRSILSISAALLLLLCSCGKTKDTKKPESVNRQLTWIKTYGGSNYDFANSIVQGTDSGYVMAGASRSVDGDLTGSRVGYDIWIAKVDTAGNKLWSKSYGGNNDEYATAIIRTNDGGYLISGHTFLPGNVYSGWVIKADAFGNQQWQRNFNQTADSKISGIVNATDGGYIVVGYNTVGATHQALVAKLDAGGNQQWSKSFGGSEADYATAIIAAPGGGYVIAGNTRSTDGDITGSKGNTDGWIIRIDAAGNKLYSRNFGGSGNDHFTTLIATPDGGFAAGGTTESSNNGDIARNNGGIDEWLIKFDGSGNKQWSRNYGGTDNDHATSLITTNSGGYALLGYTNSTNGDVSRNRGDFGGWLIKLDAGGAIQVQSTYGYDNDDFTNGVIQTADGGFMIAGYTSVQNVDYDAWLVKIATL